MNMVTHAWVVEAVSRKSSRVICSMEPALAVGIWARGRDRALEESQPSPFLYLDKNFYCLCLSFLGDEDSIFGLLEGWANILDFQWKCYNN